MYLSISYHYYVMYLPLSLSLYIYITVYYYLSLSLSTYIYIYICIYTRVTVTFLFDVSLPRVYVFRHLLLSQHQDHVIHHMCYYCLVRILLTHRICLYCHTEISGPRKPCWQKPCWQTYRLDIHQVRYEEAGSVRHALYSS